ncbi:hypothetical protein QUF80_08505 [Desulfococcaceae bacterium HSG8]|nr:hypothetical protein [Desulfococcaceae bacterium HSG8]
MKKIFTITAIFAVMIWTASVAFAAPGTLSFNPAAATVAAGGSVTVSVEADDATGIAGAALTITHPDTLTVTVASDVFATFISLGYDSADGLDTNNQVDGFDSPVVANSVSGTGTKIAAASPTALDGTNNVLFKVTFTAPADAVEDTEYPITITATSLSNEAAGYDAAGETIDILVGISGDTYPTLLSKDATGLGTGTVTIGADFTPGDVDNDGDVDIFDVLGAIDIMNMAAADQPGAAGFGAANRVDTDDIINLFDLLGIIDLMP